MDNVEQVLVDSGLEPSTAQIYSILVKNGESTVPQISEHTELSRASIYDSLSILLAKELVDYRKQGRVAFYKPNHPNKLFALIEQRKQETELFSQEMEQTIKILTGEYNLSTKKPGVRFFEGEEGFKQALYDTLESGEIVRALVNLEAIQKHADQVNRQYMADRKAKGVNMEILVFDTLFNRAYLKNFPSDITEARFLPKGIESFNTAMLIYDNKISYFTLRKKSKVAVLIGDPDIYRMQKNIFHGLWKKAKKITL